MPIFCCFQWFKDTNLKVNHNICKGNPMKLLLFPMVQRYKFESKSQPMDIRLRIEIQLFPMVQRYKFESKSQHD